MKTYTMSLPLGISRVRDETDIAGLREVLGHFEFIDFNVARTSKLAHSISIRRSKVSEASGGVGELSEIVSGLLGDQLRLTYGERVSFLGDDGISTVKVRFTSRR